MSRWVNKDKRILWGSLMVDANKSRHQLGIYFSLAYKYRKTLISFQAFKNFPPASKIFSPIFSFIKISICSEHVDCFWHLKKFNSDWNPSWGLHWRLRLLSQTIADNCLKCPSIETFPTFSIHNFNWIVNSEGGK